MQAGQDAYHGKAHGQRNGQRQADVHGPFRHGAGADLLHLLGQHMDGRLGLHDKPAHDHGDGNQKPAEGAAAQLPAQKDAQRGEAHIHAGEEQDKTHIGEDQACQNAQQRQLAQLQGNDLKQQEKDDDGGQSNGHLCHIFGNGMKIGAAQLHGVQVAFGAGGRDIRSFTAVDKAQDQHSQNGANAAQGHQTEAVGLSVLIASDRGDTDTQCHDEGHCHGAGGDAAGIEGHAEEAGVGKGCQHEHRTIEKQQQPPQLNTQQDAQHAQHQEKAHAHRHRQDQHHGVDVGNVAGQYLQVRFGDGDNDAQQEAGGQNQQQLSRLGQLGADVVAHRGHGGVGTIGKETHAHDQHHRTDDEGQHQIVGDRGDGKAQHHHDQGDGQYGGHAFPHFFVESGFNSQKFTSFLFSQRSERNMDG